jgi:hypothetical protein
VGFLRSGLSLVVLKNVWSRLIHSQWTFPSDWTGRRPQALAT